MKDDKTKKVIKLISSISSALALVIISLGYTSNEIEGIKNLNWFPYSYNSITTSINTLTLLILILCFVSSCLLLFYKEKQGHITLLSFLALTSLITTSEVSPIKNTSRLIGKASGVAITDCWFPESIECNQEKEHQLWSDDGLTLWGKENIKNYVDDEKAPFMARILVPVIN